MLLYATRQEFRLEFSYHMTRAVCIRRFSLLEVTPDRTPIRARARIDSNSSEYAIAAYLALCRFCHIF